MGECVPASAWVGTPAPPDQRIVQTAPGAESACAHVAQDDNYRACLRHVVREGVENECHVTVVLNKVDLVNPKAKVGHTQAGRQAGWQEG